MLFKKGNNKYNSESGGFSLASKKNYVEDSSLSRVYTIDFSENGDLLACGGHSGRYFCNSFKDLIFKKGSYLWFKKQRYLLT